MFTWTHIAHRKDGTHGDTPVGYANSPHSTSFRTMSWTVSSEQHITLRRPCRGR
jgi:hypothetical protein